MYKIFIKLKSNNNKTHRYDCYSENNEYDEFEEYETSDIEEIQNKVKELMTGDYSSDDIIIVKVLNKDFTVTVEDGESDGK